MWVSDDLRMRLNILTGYIAAVTATLNEIIIRTEGTVQHLGKLVRSCPILDEKIDHSRYAKGQSTQSGETK